MEALSRRPPAGDFSGSLAEHHLAGADLSATDGADRFEVLPDLIGAANKGEPLLADSACKSAGADERLEALGIINHIHEKASRNKPLDTLQIEFNRLKSTVRCSLQGWALTAGIKYVGPSYPKSASTDARQDFRIPSYTTVDAGARFRSTPSGRLASSFAAATGAWRLVVSERSMSVTVIVPRIRSRAVP
ncbi:MAG: hypothetical protein ACREIA_26000 [Opitutaceae bacterium]